MKAIRQLLDRYRPAFDNGGRLRGLKPVFEAADNFFFAHVAPTTDSPYGRDAIDIKRYMSMVIVALAPAFLASLYYFGPRILLLILVSYAAGGMVEVLFAIVRKEEINEGFLVTGFIFPLTLPPGLPLWMAAVGCAFGVLVGKEVFGGTGRNLFNAALVGRCFLAFSYPGRMTSAWFEPNPARWLDLSVALAAAPDAVTTATPLGLARGGEVTALWDMTIGNSAGSAGETAALALLAGGLLLLITRIANWRTVAGGCAALVIASAILAPCVPDRVMPPLFQLVAGGWMLGIFFMATDPVTGPVTLSAKWLYGILIGLLTVLIRGFSGFVEGVMFAILFGNICAPLLDEMVIRLKRRRYATARTPAT